MRLSHHLQFLEIWQRCDLLQLLAATKQIFYSTVKDCMSHNYQVSLAVQYVFFFLHLDFNVQLPIENLENSCA